MLKPHEPIKNMSDSCAELVPLGEECRMNKWLFLAMCAVAMVPISLVLIGMVIEHAAGR